MISDWCLAKVQKKCIEFILSLLYYGCYSYKSFYAGGKRWGIM